MIEEILAEMKRQGITQGDIAQMIGLGKKGKINEQTTENNQ